jgi:uncharacterized membrane protein YidH (DUF202 family)
MALATRPRPKVQHRKRVAQHHKHTPHYLKAYWPYLPMLAIVGFGAFANKTLDQSGLYTAASLNNAGSTTRIEAMAGQHSGLALGLVIIMAGVAMAILLFNHWFRIQRTLNRGEAFIAHHPWIDVCLVLLVTAGVLLTRQAI